MNSGSIGEQIQTRLSAVQSELKIEYQRLQDEIQAYTEFANQLESIPVTKSTPASTTGAVQIDSSSSVDHCSELKQSFEATVMAVPHYTEDYDESFLEHFGTEFTPEMAMVVVNSTEVSPRLHSMIRSQTTAAIEDREQFISTITSEQDAVEHFDTRLVSLSRQLSPTTSVEIDQLDFAGLESHWMFLAQQRQLCDEIAIDRQQQISELKQTTGSANTPNEICEYLYQDLEEAYPLLATIARLGETIHRQQTKIESAMANLE